MKIEITEEMREAVRRWREQRAAGGIAYASANDLARLVAEAVEREEIRAMALGPGPCFEDTCEKGSVPGSAFCSEHEPPLVEQEKGGRDA